MSTAFSNLKVKVADLEKSPAFSFFIQHGYIIKCQAKYNATKTAIVLLRMHFWQMGSEISAECII